jgi:hypothetical protein
MLARNHHRLAGAIALAATLALGACSGGGGTSTAKFCKDASDVNEQASSLSDQSDLADVASAMEDLADEAPAELKDDFKAIGDGMKDASDGSIDPDLDARVSKADEAIGNWVDDHC